MILDTFVVTLLAKTDLALQIFTQRTYQSLSDTLKTPIMLAATLAVMLLGISVLFDWVKLTMGEVVKLIITIGAVILITLNWGFFSAHIYGVLTGASNELTDAAMQGAPIPIPGVYGINGGLQEMLLIVEKLGGLFWGETGMLNMKADFMAMIIWGCGFLSIIFALYQIIKAKIGMALWLAIAPIIVPCKFFKKTAGYVDKWIGGLVGFMFVPIFVSLVLLVGLSLSELSLGGIVVGSLIPVTPSFSGLLPFLLVGLITAGLVPVAAGWANAIGGSVQQAGAASAVMAMGGFAMGKLSSMKGLAKGPLGALGKGTKSTAGSMLKQSAAGDVVNAIRDKLRKGQ
jgi:type IV secretory pathway VirB6-like protein